MEHSQFVARASLGRRVIAGRQFGNIGGGAIADLELIATHDAHIHLRRGKGGRRLAGEAGGRLTAKRDLNRPPLAGPLDDKPNRFPRLAGKN